MQLGSTDMPRLPQLRNMQHHCVLFPCARSQTVLSLQNNKWQCGPFSGEASENVVSFSDENEDGGLGRA
jgi:hypothetical protein